MSDNSDIECQVVSGRKRIVTVFDSSDSSEDECLILNHKKRKVTHVVIDSSSDDDNESTDDAARVVLQRPRSHSSDVGGASPQQECPVCFSKLAFPIASPDCCSHYFCLDCIQAWARTSNTCPQDRLPFLKLQVMGRVGGKVLQEVPVKEVVPTPYIPPEEDDQQPLCEVCQRGDREAQLLLCDGCNLAYHMFCLQPPLRRVPEARWYCDTCAGVDHQYLGLIASSYSGATDSSDHRVQMCVPATNPSNVLVPQDVVRTKVFLECERLLRNHFCFLDGIRPLVAIGSFAFEGLDGTLDFLENDEARAEAIMLANEKVGPDFFGLIQ